MQLASQPELTPEQMEQIREEAGDEYNLVFSMDPDPKGLESAGLPFISIALGVALFILWSIFKRPSLF